MRRVLCIVGALAMVAGLSAACTSARDTLGTNSSPCFEALPVAKAAVHGRGTFAGTRLLSAATVAKHRRIYQAIRGRALVRLQDVCLVSYTGTFDASDVNALLRAPPNGGVGHFAIVVVSRSTNKLLGTFILASEPVRFRHLALGVASGGRGGGGIAVAGRLDQVIR